MYVIWYFSRVVDLFIQKQCSYGPSGDCFAGRYGADPRDPPTREALARAEGRSLEGVSQEDVARDAKAIEQLMEIILRKEKEETAAAKVRKPHIPAIQKVADVKEKHQRSGRYRSG